MKTIKRVVTSVFILLICFVAGAQTKNTIPDYRTEFNIPYCTVDGKILTLNAFIPENCSEATPAMIDIHGGWWFEGKTAQHIPEAFSSKAIAVFSIEYRLGEEGGFPQNIRDCRNAVRFVRKNAKRFNIDPDRIGSMGGSAGAHLALMVAMVPDNFEDGGSTSGLEDFSARVCNCFCNVPPTNFIRSWNESPDDVVTASNGEISFRSANPNIPNDARPRLRILFHGIAPDSPENIATYERLSPVSYVQKDLPPFLICDGEKDPIVPGQQGKALHEKLKAAGAPSNYWMTPNAGHVDPGGEGFAKVLNDFLFNSLRISKTPVKLRENN